MFRQRILRACFGLLLGLPVLAAAGCGSVMTLIHTGTDPGQCAVVRWWQPLPGVMPLTGDTTRTATTGSMEWPSNRPAKRHHTVTISGFDASRVTFLGRASVTISKASVWSRSIQNGPSRRRSRRGDVNPGAAQRGPDGDDHTVSPSGDPVTGDSRHPVSTPSASLRRGNTRCA